MSFIIAQFSKNNGKDIQFKYKITKSEQLLLRT